jgi:hypothetical protein
VTRDDIQRLMGGYATGSLNEAERKLLFDAALEDQDLFDQLSHEHALKELIDEPGVRDRLIAKLAPAEVAVGAVRGGWKKPLAWGFAMSFVVGMSLLAVFLTKSSIQTQQIAQLDTSVVQPASPASSPASTPATPPPGPAPAPESQPLPAKKKAAAESDARAFADRREPLEKEQRKTESRKTESKDERARSDAREEARADAKKDVSIAGAIAGAPATAPPPAPPASRRQTVDQVQLASQLPAPIQPQGFVAGQNQQAPQVQISQDKNLPTQGGQTQSVQVQTSTIQAPGAAGSGGAGGRSRPAALAAPMARAATKSAPAHFAFDYAIEGEDIVFKFAADGYFSLHIVPGGLTIVDSRVTAGSTRRERINNNGTEADIVFSAAAQSTTGGLKLTSTLRSDTVEDPGGTRIELLVRFYPPPP